MAKLQNLLQVYFGHQVRYIAFLRQQLHTLGDLYQTADVLPVDYKWVTPKKLFWNQLFAICTLTSLFGPKKLPSLFMPFYQIC